MHAASLGPSAVGSRSAAPAGAVRLADAPREGGPRTDGVRKSARVCGDGQHLRHSPRREQTEGPARGVCLRGGGGSGARARGAASARRPQSDLHALVSRVSEVDLRRALTEQPGLCGRCGGGGAQRTAGAGVLPRCRPRPGSVWSGSGTAAQGPALGREEEADALVGRSRLPGRDVSSELR